MDTLRVLVADEQPEERVRLRRLGEELGWRIDEAASTDELSAWLRRPANGERRCLLLSLALGSARGWEALAACPAADPRVPVIVLAENESADLLLRAWSGGAAGFLRKSELSKEALARLVNRTMARPWAPNTEAGAGLEVSPLRVVQASCHDLRNPLSAMMINANLLLREENLSDERRTKVASRILASAQRMIRMIDELSAYAVAGQGKGVALRPSETDLLAIAADAVAETRAAHPRHEVRFEPGGALRGHWDPARLRQVLSSLLACAITRGRPGTTVVLDCAEGPAAEVEIRLDHRAAPDPPAATLAPEAQPSGEGADGIVDAGFLVARRIVEAHQGSFTTSASPNGPCFLIRLPRHVPPLAAPPTA